jgi:hypothetical protein
MFFLICLAFTNIAPIITTIELIPKMDIYIEKFLEDPTYSESKDLNQ